MRGDLQDQLRRAQSSGNDDNTSEKVIIAVAIVVLIAFIAGTIGFIAFFVKTADKFVNTEAATNINPEQASRVSELSGQIIDNISGYGTDSTTSSYSSKLTDNSNFTFGTIEGTKYYSNFSGIGFSAPADWIMTSYAKSGASSSPKDMSASGDAMQSSVIIQYESMKYRGYESASDALASTLTIASSTNNKLLSNTATANWGGNSFTGIIYAKVINDYVTYYEVLVAEVNGYALKITISASSEESLNLIRSYFT